MLKIIEAEPDHVVAVVLSSYETDVDDAAAKHSCDRSTVYRYRRAVKESPELQAKFMAAWNTQRAGWAMKLGTGRERVLTHLLELASSPNTNIKDVTAAFKAISESFVADAIMIESGQMPEPQARPSRSTKPSGTH